MRREIITSVLPLLSHAYFEMPFKLYLRRKSRFFFWLLHEFFMILVQVCRPCFDPKMYNVQNEQDLLFLNLYSSCIVHLRFTAFMLVE